MLLYSIVAPYFFVTIGEMLIVIVYCIFGYWTTGKMLSLHRCNYNNSFNEEKSMTISSKEYRLLKRLKVSQN